MFIQEQHELCSIYDLHAIWFQGFLPLKMASAECTALNVFALFCSLKYF